MKTSFNSFIDYMTEKFGFTPLINTLHSLVDSVSDNGSSVGAADVAFFRLFLSFWEQNTQRRWILMKMR